MSVAAVHSGSGGIEMKPRKFEKIIAPVEIGHEVRQGLADVDRDAIVSLEDAERRLMRQPPSTTAPTVTEAASD